MLRWQSCFFCQREVNPSETEPHVPASLFYSASGPKLTHFKLLLAQTPTSTFSNLIRNQDFWFFFLLHGLGSPVMIFFTSPFNHPRKHFTAHNSSAMKIIHLINETIKSNCKTQQTVSSLISELNFWYTHIRVFSGWVFVTSPDPEM